MRFPCLLAPALGVATLVAVPAAGDLPQLQKRGTLRVLAATEEQPEMFTFRGGAEPGFEREMLEGFARLQRLRLVVVPVRGFQERIPALLRGDGDVIVGLIDTPERRQEIAFTNEVMPARHVVVTYSSRRPVTTLSQFRAERVGVLKGTTWEKQAQEAGVPAESQTAFADLGSLLGALRAGQITATVMSVSDMTLAMKRDPGLQAGLFLGEPGHAAWGVRLEDRQLRAALDEYLDYMRRSASWNRLVVKYFGEQALLVLGKSTRR
jgi:ABC-type amino acid transport substrate-binding protein